MSGPYSMFETDADRERKGVPLEYGDFTVHVARAGGANRNYQKALEKQAKPLRRALQTGNVDAKRVSQIMKRVFAETVVLGWDGVCDIEGNELEFTVENCIQLFNDLPDFFADVQEQASGIQLFRAENREADAGN